MTRQFRSRKTTYHIQDFTRIYGEPGYRETSFIDRLFYLNIKQPWWCNKSDDLWGLFQNKWDILENGILVWGYIIQANERLFNPGFFNHPASVLFCLDDQDVDLNTLSIAASKMYQLKNTMPDDPDLLKIANTLTDELTRTFGVKVPSQFSNGYNLFEASTYISRKHLPNKVLSNSFFPIVVSKNAPHYNLPLPSRYWPDSFIDYW